MPAPGTTGDLYIDADDPNSLLGAPPSAPAPVPPPVQPVRAVEPVTTHARMADQNPDGSMRDTSMEALEKKNDLGFRNVSDDELRKEPEPEPAAEPVVAAPEPTPAPAIEKLYAGKYKTPEELEKGYENARQEMQRAQAERDEFKRKAEATPPPPPAPKTPEQLATEEAANQQFLADFVANPKQVISKFQQEAAQQTATALAAQQVANEWRKTNPDIAAHEEYVGFEASRLMQSDPELAKDPQQLLEKATANFRQLTGKLRSEGAKEALTQQTRVIPLLSNTAPSTASGNPPKEAPLTSDQAFDLHMKSLKEAEQKSHRGLRR